MIANKTETQFNFKTFTPNNVAEFPKEQVVDFLFTHLQEYGDAKTAIAKCLDYAMSQDNGKGGAVIVAYHEQEMVGAVVLNNTGMQEYIPEQILVYIAVHGNYRGKGLGKLLMQEAIQNTTGSIALHVEPQNPARYLYEKLGFTNKYLEYRLQR
ncbi:MAG: GNAT family N-acetyltransferase [Hymenobacteraceae bacterium]|nr:GNAT family N-acetyltransferase [Hymenobacteraceae bacterium]MDX5397507.1 GNAT family N-acetyltransferase [Hymenobacteraceae bacterium]MDX5442598.1 GNAT family N-acetyltransferase [Hymenobacteraceae bacterium]MDX5513586.1 GNAT family N-acetyltransferase [Hymenobacteraceae bacterium]